ncbi:MAG: hypothetical protein RL291_175, partial [Pseudomonadota bacterium]
MLKVRATFAAVALAAAGTFAAPAANAQSPSFTFSPNVSFTSDYIFRGFSQTARKATGQGGFDVGYGIFYAGVWASGLRFGEL